MEDGKSILDRIRRASSFGSKGKSETADGLSAHQIAARFIEMNSDDNSEKADVPAEVAKPNDPFADMVKMVDLTFDDNGAVVQAEVPNPLGEIVLGTKGELDGGGDFKFKMPKANFTGYTTYIDTNANVSIGSNPLYTNTGRKPAPKAKPMPKYRDNPDEVAQNKSKSQDQSYDEQIVYHVDMLGQYCHVRGYEHPKLVKWLASGPLEKIIAETAEKLKPEPVNNDEEIVVNFNELVDTLAKNEIKSLMGDFNPEVHVDMYKQTFDKYLKIVQSHNRKEHE